MVVVLAVSRMVVCSLVRVVFRTLDSTKKRWCTSVPFCPFPRLFCGDIRWMKILSFGSIQKKFILKNLKNLSKFIVSRVTNCSLPCDSTCRVRFSTYARTTSLIFVSQIRSLRWWCQRRDMSCPPVVRIPY